MLGKCINCTSKKIVATTLALTLTFSSFATLTSFKTNATGEETKASENMNNTQSNLGNKSKEASSVNKVLSNDEEYEEYEDEYEYEYEEYEDEYYKVNYNYMKYENDEDYDAELHKLLVYKLSVNNKLEEAEYDYDQAKRDLAIIYSDKTVQENSSSFISDYTRTESIINETQVKEAKEKVDSALKEKRGLEKMAEAIDDAFFAHAGSQEYLERYKNKVVLDLEILSTFEFNIYELNEALKEAKTAMKENETTGDYSEYEAVYEEAKKELEDEISNVENQGYEVVKSNI